MIVRGDARDIPLKDNSVQVVVTSPPYWGLRDYGVANQLGLEPTPELYVEHMVAVFRQVRRVLRDDGTCWVNLGDSYAGSGKGIGSDHGKAVFTDREISKTNWDNSGLKPKDLVGIPWRVAFALQSDGWYLRSDIIWSKLNPMPESVTDRPTKSHEYIFLLSKKERYYFDQDAVREPNTDDMIRRAELGHTRGANGKLDSSRMDADTLRGEHAKQILANGKNIRTVWKMATQPYPEAHFATFPEALIKPCILAGAPVGGVVFDPFVGSGTTVKVAQDLGRVGIGLDLKPEYTRMAKVRSAQMGMMLFAQREARTAK